MTCLGWTLSGGGHNRLAEARPSFSGIEIESFVGNIVYSTDTSEPKHALSVFVSAASVDFN